MRYLVFLLATAVLAVPVAIVAQSPEDSSSLTAMEAIPDGAPGQMEAPGRQAEVKPSASFGPFSRLAVGGSFSPLGVGMQMTTNINGHLNLRATGDFFDYSTNISTNGFTANAKLNLASAGAALDVYPFRAGFRISPGVMFYNQNRLSASSTVAGGTSFNLNGDTFYSANANAETGATPINGNALLGLHAARPAFTITGGWGNAIPRSGSHWAFPFEIGVALAGAPTLNVNLNGWACYDQAQTECTNIASTTDPIAIQIQNDLSAQVATWKKDLEPLKTYPIISFGVAYSFRIR